MFKNHTYKKHSDAYLSLLRLRHQLKIQIITVFDLKLAVWDYGYFKESLEKLSLKSNFHNL